MDPQLTSISLIRFSGKKASCYWGTPMTMEPPTCDNLRELATVRPRRLRALDG